MPAERRPNFFIVGVQKAGTSALAVWLGRHPQVFMSSPKEPGYLAFLEKGYGYADGYGRPAPAGKYVVSDQQDYLDLFSAATPGNRVIGEASTWYFSIPGVAARIKGFSPDAKVVVVLRNPCERAYSAWCHARRDNLEPCADFSSALAQEDERGDVEFLLRYRRMGLYSEALAEYLSIFDPSRLLVLLYEDTIGDEIALWQKLCDFLAIYDFGEPPPRRKLNRSGQFRSRSLEKLLRSPGLRAAARTLLPRHSAGNIRDSIAALNLKSFPGLDEEERRELQDFYRKDITELARMIGRDLSSWLA